MVSLSQIFPQELTNIAVNNYLKAGAVVRLFCDFTTPPKFKYMMIATVEPLQVFIINSEINAYIQSNETLLADQIDIPYIDHQFLDHDSVLNCIEAHRTFNLSHLKQKMMDDFSQIYKGNLKPYILRTVIDVVEKSVNLSRITKNQVISAIKQDNGV